MTFELLDTTMRSAVVLVTVNPSIVIQLLLEIAKPLVCPLTTTVAPGAVVKTIGADCVPELAIVTFSL